jgi:hypothetical protein
MEIPDGSPTVARPERTLVVGQDGAVKLVIAGVLLLPLGSRVELPGDEGDAAVVGIRLGGLLPGTQLILEVDAGGSSFDREAIEEAEAELEVVEAAEEITAAVPPEVASTDPTT